MTCSDSDRGDFIFHYTGLYKQNTISVHHCTNLLPEFTISLS